jgi:hypothetical protein
MTIIKPSNATNIWRLVDQNSFIRKRPFLANNNITFANLSRTPTFIFRRDLMFKSFAKSFAKETLTFCERSQVGTLAARLMDNLYMDL